jgi:hypothetical protein
VRVAVSVPRHLRVGRQTAGVGVLAVTVLAALAGIVVVLLGHRYIGAALLVGAVAGFVVYAVVTSPSGLEEKVAKQRGWDAQRTHCKLISPLDGGQKLFHCAQHTGGFLDEYDGQTCVAVHGDDFPPLR